MKTTTTSLLVVLLLAGSFSVTGAQDRPPTEPRLATREEIAAVVGGMANADALLVQALDYWLRANDSPRTVGVPASLFPGELSHPSVQFIRLDDDGLKTNIEACGISLLVVVRQVMRDQMNVHVSENTKCGRRLSSYDFTETPYGWELLASSAGGLGATGQCDCR